MRTRLPALLALGLVLAVGVVGLLRSPWSPVPARSCTPPAGGRCAADVAWSGPVTVSPDGRTLHATILCGGTLRVTRQTAARVEVRLHLTAVGPGAMSCARVDVRAHLTGPLDDRPVYDAVSHQRLAVTGAAG